MIPDPGEPSTGQPRVGIARDEGVILASVSRGKHVLEIGTGLGISTRLFCEVAASVYTVDIDPWVHEHILPALLQEFPHLQASRHWPVVTRFDVIFIDADHHTEAVTRDFIQALPLLAPGGCIVFHDASYSNVASGMFSLRRPITVHPTTHGLGIYHDPL